MARILVTGGTGFIGTYVVDRLLREEPATKLRLLARSPERLSPRVRALAELVEGDITDRRAVHRSMAGVHTVLHLAALARAWSPDPDAFRKANVDALAVLLAEAREAGVKRLVHVSTLIATDRAPERGEHGEAVSAGSSPYAASKREGERLIADYVASGRHAVIVRPTRVYGPGPLHDANGVTKMVDLYLRGRFRTRLADHDVRASYVHADDVAQAVLLARRGGSGTAYTAGGQNVSLRAFLELVSEIAGVRRRMVAMPPWAAYAMAGIAELSGRLGATPFVTRDWIRTFLEDWPADIEPARRDLGYEPRPLRTGLEQTIAWLRSPAAPRLVARPV